MASGVDVEFTADNFAVIRMRRGENRINEGFVDAFSTALDKVERNQSCRAVIITGEGRFFSNGFDIQNVINQDERERNEFLQKTFRFFDRILTFPMPTVAAINGHAFAGGGFLALSCDFRVMRTGFGWISWNEIFLKVPLPSYFLEMIKCKLSQPQALLQAVVYGKRFTAEEAVSHGFVDIVSPPDTLLQEATALAKRSFGRQPYDRDMFTQFKIDVYRSLHEIAVSPGPKSRL